MKITFDARCHIWKAAAKEDSSRSVRQGVFCDADNKVLVAANGFICAVAPCEIEAPEKSVIIPGSVVKKAVEWAFRERANIEIRGDRAVALSSYGAREYSDALIEGALPFPTWKQLIPESLDPAKATNRLGLNSNLLATLCEAIGTSECLLFYATPASQVVVIPSRPKTRYSRPSNPEIESFGFLMPLYVNWAHAETRTAKRLRLKLKGGTP